MLEKQKKQFFSLATFFYSLRAEPIYLGLVLMQQGSSPCCLAPHSFSSLATNVHKVIKHSLNSHSVFHISEDYSEIESSTKSGNLGAHELYKCCGIFKNKKSRTFPLTFRQELLKRDEIKVGRAQVLKVTLKSHQYSL